MGIGKENTRESVSERLREIVSEQLCIPKEDVADGREFVNDMGADEIDIAEIAIITEDEYGICISEKTMCGADTFGKFVNAVWDLYAEKCV